MCTRRLRQKVIKSTDSSGILAQKYPQILERGPKFPKFGVEIINVRVVTCGVEIINDRVVTFGVEIINDRVVTFGVEIINDRVVTFGLG